MRKLAVFLEAIKFEHTIFALPFAYTGMLLASAAGEPGRLPAAGTVMWITLAMATARTFAMALNRLIDREIDARNPRTAGRALPRGLLSSGEMRVYAVAAGSILALAAWQLNPLCLALMPGAVAVLAGYSYTKRFTSLCHVVLGVAIGLAPVGAWTAVTGTLDPRSLVLGLAVALWIAGFDVLYACQDVAFDRQAGLHSIPAQFGVHTALRVSAALHVLTVAALGLVGLTMGLGAVYWLGVAGAAGLLVYEHSLLRPNDLSRMDMAFFNVNGYIALLLFVATAGDLAWRGALSRAA